MSTPWVVPPMWRGRTVLVMASGPSLLSAITVAAAAVQGGEAAAIAINSTGIPLLQPDGTIRPAAFPWADMLYGADAAWWLYYAQPALQFPGLKVCVSELPFRSVHRLQSTGLLGYDPEPGCIRTGGNSAYQAAHIAIDAGAKRVLLCGVDLHDRQGSHHHGDHPAPLRKTAPGSFALMRERWASLAEPAARLGVEIINCSSGSDLDCFPRQDIREALC